jgi:hypothetical protein
MAARSLESRKLNFKREKEAYEAGLKAALENRPDQDQARKERVQRQIDTLLDDMEDCSSLKQRIIIGSAIERLWKLVQPTAGVLRPKKQDRQPITLPTPQEPSAS